VSRPPEPSQVQTLAEQVLVKPQVKARPWAAPAAKSLRVPSGLFTLALMVTLVTAMLVSYVRSGKAVTLEVNGQSWRARTHQQTVRAFLREVGLVPRPEDIVLPQLDTLLAEGQTIVVQRALPVLVEADGQILERYTHSRTVADMLREAGVDPKPYDVVALDNVPVALSAALPDAQWTPSRWPLSRATMARSNSPSLIWTRVVLQRAVPLSILDGGTQTLIHAVARTVGEALLSQGIVLYLGDRVQPLLGTLLTAGMHLEIYRAKPVTLQVDGRVVQTRTQAHDVAQLLSEVGVVLSGNDYAIPSLATQVTGNLDVRIVRVVEDWIIDTEDIPFATVRRADSNLELDQQRTDNPGRNGVRKRRVHMVYEDGKQTEREVTEEWVERDPTTRIISYGTKIIIRELETPDGIIRYWRKVRVLATSYTAATSGKEPDHPEYGITRLGWRARKGIIAVDPLVIGLRTNMYVPGYGFGTAGDTGGKIKGRWIDLCYDEDNLVLWKRWLDVYLLEPVPALKDIPLTLPSYPTEPR
jgi:uncharacterized protein YabE (DUF348 family)